MYPTPPDSPNDKQRRNRQKFLTANRLIAFVLILAAICLLWTTEWMNRLRVFGNKPSLTEMFTNDGPEKPPVPIIGIVPIEKPDASVVYDVFEMNEVQDPIDINKAENGKPSENGAKPLDDLDEFEPKDEPKIEQKEAIDVDEVPTDESLPIKPSFTRLPICVVSSNPRTASLFHTKTLQRKGGGKFDYLVTSKTCEPETRAAPVTVRMLYQKSLTGLSNSVLNDMFSSPQNLIIVMGDEFCRCPLDICSF